MIPAAAELAASLGLRRVGRGWRGACPVHGGSSFALDERDGRPVWTCWSGCDRGAILEELRLRGLWPAARQEWTPEEKRRWAEARREAEGLAAMRADLIRRCRERRNVCWDAGSGARRWLWRNAAAPWDSEKTLYALRWADEGERRGDMWEERLRSIEAATAAELRELRGWHEGGFE